MISGLTVFTPISAVSCLSVGMPLRIGDDGLPNLSRTVVLIVL